MILQAENKTFRAVSYRNDLHEQFSRATKVKSPIKLTKFKHIEIDMTLLATIICVRLSVGAP